jgi:hypothetical protein
MSDVRGLYLMHIAVGVSQAQHGACWELLRRETEQNCILRTQKKRAAGSKRIQPSAQQTRESQAKQKCGLKMSQPS